MAIGLTLNSLLFKRHIPMSLFELMGPLAKDPYDLRAYEFDPTTYQW